jgi:hypothetical protein
MISHIHTKKEWMLSYRFMNMGMKELTAGTEEVFYSYLMAPERMNMQMHMFMGMYGITDRLTAMVMLNYQVNSMEMNMYTMHHSHGNMSMSSPQHSMNTSGLGDVKVQALHGVVQRDTWQLLVTLGASIPTGNIYLKGKSDDAMYANARYPYGMQLGSGTVDVLPGISHLYQRNGLALGTTVSGIYRAHRNSLGYKLGNEATLSSWIAYQWLTVVSSSVRVEGTVAGPVQGRDAQLYTYMEPSTNPVNYGGKRINAYIGSSFHFKGALKNNRLGVEYGLPLYQQLNGFQLMQTYGVNAFWALTF